MSVAPRTELYDAVTAQAPARTIRSNGARDNSRSARSDCTPAT